TAAYKTCMLFFFSSRRRHTRFSRDWSSDVCSSDLTPLYRHPLLSARLGFDAYVKHENHLPIGAFKVRGGIHLLASLGERELKHRSEERRVGKECRAQGSSKHKQTK